MKDLDDEGKQGLTNVTNAMFLVAQVITKNVKATKEINKKDRNNTTRQCLY